MNRITEYLQYHRYELIISFFLSVFLSILVFISTDLIYIVQSINPLPVNYVDEIVPIIFSVLSIFVSVFCIVQLRELFAQEDDDAYVTPGLNSSVNMLPVIIYGAILLIGIVGYMQSQSLEYWTIQNRAPVTNDYALTSLPNPIRFLDDTMFLHTYYPVTTYPQMSSSRIQQKKQAFLKANGSAWSVTFDKFGYITDAIESIPKTSSDVLTTSETQQWISFLKRNGSFWGIDNTSNYDIHGLTNTGSTEVVATQDVILEDSPGPGMGGQD